MSILELKRFEAFAQENDEVRELVGSLKGDPEGLAKLAVQHGFSLERADFEIMSDEELEGVTGAGFGTWNDRIPNY